MENYIDEVQRTNSNTFHGDKVSKHLFLRVLDDCIYNLKRLDKIKKSLFYGREHGLNDMDTTGLTMNKVYEYLDADGAGQHLLHGIVGFATEAGEQLEALEKAITNGHVIDKVNLCEEVGDGFWYAGITLRYCGQTFSQVQHTNIAKLRARFPDKFTEDKANNRDLGAERKILETGMSVDQKLDPVHVKPQRHAESWFVIGSTLFGQNEEGLDFRSSKILNYDTGGKWCETVNTMYILGKAAADL